MVTWRMELPVTSRTPMTPKIFYSLACMKGFAWHTSRAHIWLPVGVLLRVGFKGFLRPNEVGTLRGGSVLLPTGGLGMKSSCVLLVDAPKNKRVLGRMQYVMIKDGSAALWLAWLSKELPRSLLLLPGATPQLRACLQELSHDCDIAELHLVLGSLRSGGATEYRDEVGNLQLLSHLGRWRNPRSLEHYPQETIAFLITNSLTPSAEGKIDLLDTLYWECFQAPPRRS